MYTHNSYTIRIGRLLGRLQKAPCARPRQQQPAAGVTGGCDRLESCLADHANDAGQYGQQVVPQPVTAGHPMAAAAKPNAA
jgi:hypothetical protein